MANYYSEGKRVDGAISLEASNTMIRKVYLWMVGALAITGLTAYYAATTPAVMQFIFGNRMTWILLLFAELGLVIGLSAAIDRLSATTATLMFILYSVVNGLTLSSIFIVYQLGSIANTFFISAATFGVMALYGAISKRDLTKIGSFCSMALIGLIIAMIVGLFIHSTAFEIAVSVIGVIIFTGLTAYDSQKIKSLLIGCEENEVTTKIAILGALTLYLDFINLFLMLLRIFGSRR